MLDPSRPIDLPRRGLSCRTGAGLCRAQLYESVELRVNRTGRAARVASAGVPAVAHAVDGLDRVETGVHGEKLRPNPLYLRRDRPVVEDRIRRGHELLAALHVPRVLGERKDDPELGQCERDRVAAPVRRHPIAVEREGALLEPLALGLVLAQRLDPAEQRRDAREQVLEAHALREVVIADRSLVLDDRNEFRYGHKTQVTRRSVSAWHHSAAFMTR